MSKRSYLRIKEKLLKMGLQMDPKIFIYMRLISCIILFAITFFTNKYGYIIAPLMTIIYYFLVEYIILDLGINSHAKELESNALDFFPLFLIHLEGTRNVKKALYFTTSIINNPLSREFTRVLNNVEIGKSLEESLELMKNHLPSENLKTIVTSLIESHRVGSKINTTINLELGYIEERKHQRILNKLRIIPLKLALISIIFVFLMLAIIIFIKIYML